MLRDDEEVFLKPVVSVESPTHPVSLTLRSQSVNVDMERKDGQPGHIRCALNPDSLESHSLPLACS